MKIKPSKLEAFSETWFQANREEFAAMLAAGEELLAFGKRYLNFENVEDRLYEYHEAEHSAALKLCAISPEIGGKHVKKLLETVALELVDAFKDGFRASYEEEINRKDAA